MKNFFLGILVVGLFSAAVSKMPTKIEVVPAKPKYTVTFIVKEDAVGKVVGKYTNKGYIVKHTCYDNYDVLITFEKY